MPLRDINLPDDLNPLAKMIVQTFQYPENPSWSVQTDEKELIVDGIKNIARIWPLIKFASLFSEQLNDMFHGCVWEENGEIVGTAIVQRRGSSALWVVGTVGVLPPFRRRGIAKKCIVRALEIIRGRGGQKATLSVIDGNIPALHLYESLGFETFSGNVEFQAFPENPPDLPLIPEDTTLSPTSFFNWEPRYQLAKITTPETNLKYEPVEEARFKQSGIMRVILPLIILSQGVKEQWLLLKKDETGQVVGYGGYSFPRSPTKGFNSIWLHLDPAHGELARPIIQYLVHQVVKNHPGRRVECSLPDHMHSVIEALEDAGFERRVSYHRMGMII